MAQGKLLDCLIISNGIEHKITTKHPVYRLRYTILTRCYNAAKRDFPYYQGRGIKVFGEWIVDQNSFFQWCFDNGWSQGLALDRKDPDKDYTPENCQFISKKNNLEKMHQQRELIGETAPHAILKEKQVLEIKKLLNMGVTCVRIARDFGVSKGAISMIKRGANWKHLIEETECHQ
jgi:hypothetical protein